MGVPHISISWLITSFCNHPQLYRINGKWDDNYNNFGTQQQQHSNNKVNLRVLYIFDIIFFLFALRSFLCLLLLDLNEHTQHNIAYYFDEIRPFGS
jgi:hypothetical protein